MAGLQVGIWPDKSHHTYRSGTALDRCSSTIYSGISQHAFPPSSAPGWQCPYSAMGTTLDIATFAAQWALDCTERTCHCHAHTDGKELRCYLPVSATLVAGWTTHCYAPNTFGTVNMEHTINLSLSWSKR